LASKPEVTVSDGLASKPAAMVSDGLASKPVVTVSGGLASKHVATVFGGLASKPAVTVSRFGSQNRRLRFSDLGLKITATVSWFGAQNQAGFGLSVAPQNQRREIGVGYTSSSSGLLHVEASWVRFFQFGSKLAEARWRVVHVAQSRRLRRSQVEDGRVDATSCIRPCYHCFAIFILLGPRGIVVI
jgi:hypothetical protein